MKLFMDSSTNYLFLALYDDRTNDVLDSLIRNGKNDHSETLIDYLKLLLDKNHLNCDDITDVFVGRGPGSYTGVRISGTIAKVLSLVKEKHLYSFSTLDLLLTSKIDEEGTYLAKIIAKKNYSYYKIGTIQNGKILFQTSDEFGPDELLLPYGDLEKEKHFIEVNDEVFTKVSIMVKAIMKNKLYQKEDVFTYVPNYLRSEING